jgi:hypothetical protein
MILRVSQASSPRLRALQFSRASGAASPGPRLRALQFSRASARLRPDPSLRALQFSRASGAASPAPGPRPPIADTFRRDPANPKVGVYPLESVVLAGTSRAPSRGSPGSRRAFSSAVGWSSLPRRQGVWRRAGAPTARVVRGGVGGRVGLSATVRGQDPKRHSRFNGNTPL